MVPPTPQSGWTMSSVPRSIHSLYWKRFSMESPPQETFTVGRASRMRA
jgi:hypothetical protein